MAMAQENGERYFMTFTLAMKAKAVVTVPSNITKSQS
jgi:hypothetical protein